MDSTTDFGRRSSQPGLHRSRAGRAYSPPDLPWREVNFSPLDAALTGLDVIRERPRTLALWIVLDLVVGLIFGLTLLAVGAPLLIQSQGVADGAFRVAMLRSALHGMAVPALGLCLLQMLFIRPMVATAMNRAVLRPNQDRCGYLRLGMDEVRQMILSLAHLAVSMGAALTIAAAALAIEVVAGLVVFVLTRDASAGPVAASSLVLVPAAVIGGMAFFEARLCLASAQTFDTGRVNLFGSWRLTRGKVLPLIGAFATTVGISVLVLVVMAALLAGLEIIPVSPSDMAFHVMRGLLTALITTSAAVVLIPVWMTPPAAVYLSTLDPDSIGLGPEVIDPTSL